MLKACQLKFLFAVSLLLVSAQSQAGWLIAPYTGWSSYAFQPVAEEDTPNYYGYSGGMHLGYSALQMFDITAYGEYTPGNLSAADPLDSNSEFYQYGGGFAIRIYRVLYLGFHGGVASYHLPVRAKVEEIGGKWEGSAYGFRIGGLVNMTRTLSWQVALGLTTANMSETTGEITPSDRTIDHFSLSVSFVYNSEDSLGIVDAIFSNSIQSLFR